MYKWLINWPFRLCFALVVLACMLSSQIIVAQSTGEPVYDSARALLNRNEYEKAIALFNRFLPVARIKKDSFLLGNTYIGIGIANDRTGNYETALQNYFLALHWFELINHKSKIGGTLKNIGNLYRVLKTYDKAFVFFQQAIQQLERVPDSVGVSNVLNDIGILYMEQDNNEKAIGYFKQVISEYKHYVRATVLPYALNNLALSLTRINRLKEASGYYEAALDSMRSINDRYGIALVYDNFSGLYLKLNQPGQALEYSKRSLVIGEELRSNELLSQTYKGLADCYTALGDYRSANASLEKYSSLKDSLFKEETARRSAEMETKYQTAKKQGQISLLQKENVIKKKELSHQKLTRNFLITAIVLVLIIVVILYRNYTIKRAINEALNDLNTQLDEANKAKSKLLGIISHDLRTPVSSLLSLLNLRRNNPNRFTQQEQDKYDKQIADAAGNALDVMGDLLIWSKSQMESFTPYHETVHLHSLCEEIIQLNQVTATEKQILLVNEVPANLTLHTDPNFLRVIIRNLVNNAVKFTPIDGRIALSGYSNNNSIALGVKDNGPGMDAKQLATIFDWNSIRSDSSGLGLKLAKEFAGRLHAGIEVNSVPGEGTEFIVRFSPENL